MKNVEILDKDFNRLCWMTNEPEKGLHFYGDKLSTTIDSGVYTLEFRVPKRTSDGTHNKKVAHLKENNYLRFQNRQNVPILMSIKHIVDNRNDKSVYAEDVSISLINSVIDGMETPTEPQTIDYYLTPVLNKTGFLIGNNESTEKKILELSGYQNALERVRHIIHSFEMEFYFRVEFTDLKDPKFYIHIVQERSEGDLGFRISSDDVVRGLERTVNTDNIITKLIVRGRAKEVESTATPEVEAKPETPKNNFVEAVITEAMRIRDMKLPYRWGGNGLSGFDCSGFVSWCFRTAKYPGYPTSGRPTTNSMWTGHHSSYFTRVSRANVQRGDILLWDTGYTYPGDANHTGIALDNKQAIHSGNPNGIIQNIDSMKFIGAIRVKGG